MEQQHQGLLESVATFMRAINPRSIVDHFLARIARAEEDVIINDDIRDDQVDLPVLRACGFRVVRVTASAAQVFARLERRKDLQTLHETPLNAILARIVADYVLVNDGSLDALAAQASELATQLIRERVHVPFGVTHGGGGAASPGTAP